MLLFYTGEYGTQMRFFQARTVRPREAIAEVVSSLLEIKDMGFEIRDCVARGNLTRFGELMDLHWQTKKRLAKGISNPRIDGWYQLAKRHGTIGGKITGAGGGGFLTLYCEGPKTALREAMRGAGLRELNFRFEFEGSKVIFDIVSRDGRLAHMRRLENAANAAAVEV